jgi:hypothetical protein
MGVPLCRSGLSSLEEAYPGNHGHRGCQGHFPGICPEGRSPFVSAERLAL